MKLSPLTKKDYLILLFIACSWTILLSVTYIFTEVLYLYGENISLEKNLEKSNLALSVVKKNNMDLVNKLSNTEQNLRVEKETSSNYQNQVENIKSAVGVLEKLTKTDTELLKKYSKVYFLNENYVPEKLSLIPPRYLLDKTKLAQIHTDVLSHLEPMLESASSSGKVILVASGYRSFGDQVSLKSQYKVVYGSGANKFSADQGYSEHQLGTTIDLTTPKLGTNFSQFDKTDEYNWLAENSYKFGFILSYPKENKFYIFEPWHFRYVGVTLARKIHDQNTYFYALDQREINQYLINIFDI